MKNKILNGLGYFFCAGLGLFTLILFAIPYLLVYSQSVDKNSMIPIVTDYYSINVSGYQVMQMWDLGFGGVISSLLQIFVLVLSLLMLAWGVCGCLKVFGVFNSFPDKVWKVKSKTISNILLYIYLALNVLLLVFLIIVTATNVYTYEYTYTIETMGIKFSAGLFLTLIIIIALVVTLYILNKKYSVNEEELNAVYICSGCGRKANPRHNFCFKCGERIIRQEKDQDNKDKQEEQKQFVEEEKQEDTIEKQEDKRKNKKMKKLNSKKHGN